MGTEQQERIRQERTCADWERVDRWLEIATSALSDDGDALAGLVSRLRAPNLADEPSAIEQPSSPQRGALVRLYGPREVVEAFDEDMLTDLRNRIRACARPEHIEDVVLDIDPELPDWTRTDGLLDTHET